MYLTACVNREAGLRLKELGAVELVEKARKVYPSLAVVCGDMLHLLRAPGTVQATASKSA